MLRASLILTGFTAVVAQVVLMRELMVVCYGNELSLGLTLAAWLLWTAFGSMVLGRLLNRAARPRRAMAAVQVLAGAALPLTVAAVRAARGVLGAAPGEVLGPLAVLGIAVLSLSLFCVLSGSLFAVGSRLFAAERGVSLARATGTAYLLEAVGSGAGGCLAGVLLVKWFGSAPIAVGVAWLNLAAATALVCRQRTAAVVALAAALPLPLATARLETASLAWLWRGFHLLASENSLYGNLAVVAGEGSTTIYENGLPLYSAPDPAAAEEAVHYALLEHPAPRTLLLVGGGLNGSVAQALQHPTLERVDYVELDPAIPALAARWMPVPANPRAHLHLTDGRLFLRTTPLRFDVIALNLPDPQTAQLNRFYTVEFFREAARKLNPGGVLSLRLPGAENYIGAELAAFLRSIDKTLRQVFPEVRVMPGAEVHFFAALTPGTLIEGADAFIARLRERRLKTEYVREYYLPFRLMPDRVRDLEDQIRPAADTPVNRDFAPIAYYRGMVNWSARFGSRYRQALAALGEIGFLPVAGAALLLVGALAVPLASRPRAGAALCVSVMGFTGIALEILLLVAFQAIYGYVYYQLALLIAGYMAGGALGSWLALEGRAPRLGTIQIMAALAPLALYGSFLMLARYPVPAAFPALALVAGSLGGLQFPVAGRAFFGAAKAGPAGALYAADLLGASLAALAISTWLVPVFGFFRTALLTALVNVPAVWAALRRAPETPAP